jgi:hypothetical protein
MSEPAEGHPTVAAGRRPSRALVIALAVLVLLIVCAGVTTFGAQQLTDANAYRTGGCVLRKGNAIEPAGCASDRAMRILARVPSGGPCPAEAEVMFTSERFTLCLGEP